MRIRRLLLTLALAFAVPFAAPVSGQTAVDLELALLVDDSGSIDGTEFALQRTGYVDAFNNPAIWNAISQGALGRIAVSYTYFSGGTQQQTSVGWTLIDSEAAMNNFATAIAGTGRPFQGTTGVGSALQYATDELNSNAFRGTRSVIDVSGDGCTNSGIASSTGRAYADANGVDAINGLVIQPQNSSQCYPDANVLAHYENQVVLNGFVEVANDFPDFGEAVDGKIEREIRGEVVPEPSTVILLATGLLGVAGIGVRRRREGAESEAE